jgi:alanyl-tRNA synthetase
MRTSETLRLYYEDPYMREFEAVVLAIEGEGVILDQTAFYPEGGGQASDTGTISGVRVINTILDQGRIIHLLEKTPPFLIGDTVQGTLDWDRRYSIMKLHSAAHIVEYFLFQRLGPLRRLGSHVDERKDRADYAYEGRLPPEALKWVEARVNNFIVEGHPIDITLDPDRPGWRIWRCGPMEMYCGGTHVRNTREIGRIRLRRRNPGRGIERVETLLAES